MLIIVKRRRKISLVLDLAKRLDEKVYFILLTFKKLVLFAVFYCPFPDVSLLLTYDEPDTFC